LCLKKALTYTRTHRDTNTLAQTLTHTHTLTALRGDRDGEMDSILIFKYC